MNYTSYTVSNMVALCGSVLKPGEREKVLKPLSVVCAKKQNAAKLLTNADQTSLKRLFPVPTYVKTQRLVSFVITLLPELYNYYMKHKMCYTG